MRNGTDLLRSPAIIVITLRPLGRLAIGEKARAEPNSKVSVKANLQNLVEMHKMI